MTYFGGAAHVGRIDILKENNWVCSKVIRRMLTFTDFVPEAETRYTCGWVFFGLLLGLMITFNLIIVLYQTI